MSKRNPLVKCGACGSQVSRSAPSCPQCGHLLQRKKRFTPARVIGCGCLGPFAFLIFLSLIAPPPERDQSSDPSRPQSTRVTRSTPSKPDPPHESQRAALENPKPPQRPRSESQREPARKPQEKANPKFAQALERDGDLVSLDSDYAEIRLGSNLYTLKLNQPKQIVFPSISGVTLVRADAMLRKVDLDSLMAQIEVQGADARLVMNFDTPPQPAPASTSTIRAAPKSDSVQRTVGALDRAVQGMDAAFSQAQQQIEAGLVEAERIQADFERQQREAAELQVKREGNLRVSNLSETLDEYGYRAVYFEVENRNRKEICTFATFDIIWYGSRDAVLASTLAIVDHLPPRGKKVLSGQISDVPGIRKYDVELRSASFE